MMTYAALLLALVAQGLPPKKAQDPTKPPAPGNFGPITFWDGEYLVAEVTGASGTFDQTTKTGVVKDGHAIYYSRAHRLSLDFPVGDIDGKNNRFNLPEGGVVIMEDGTRLDASELLLEYATRRLTTMQPVKLTKPNDAAVLTGSGLEADDGLKQILIPKNGYLEIHGRPEELSPRHAATGILPDPALSTILRSKGPLILRNVGEEPAVAAGKKEKEGEPRKMSLTDMT